METEKKSYKYLLKWSGRTDSPVVQMAFAYCKSEIPICKDTCIFVDYDQYMSMVTTGEVEEPSTYWKIEPGQVGMVCFSSYANEYALSWENLSHCYRDFMAGYAACEKKYQYLRDWDAAIEHNIKREKYLKKCKRSFIFNVEDWEQDYYPIYDPHASKVRYYRMRHGGWKFNVTDTCTGPELEELVYNITRDCRVLMPMMEEDPRKVECKQWHNSAPTPSKKVFKKLRKTYTDPAESCVCAP